MGGKLGRINPKTAPKLQATRDDILWAAGVYEGDGSCQRIGPGWKTGIGGSTERVRVTQKDPWLLATLRDKFGGSIYKSNGHNSRWPDATQGVWAISGARARGFMLSIYGLLSPRRQGQIRRTMLIGEFKPLDILKELQEKIDHWEEGYPHGE